MQKLTDIQTRNTIWPFKWRLPEPLFLYKDVNKVVALEHSRMKIFEALEWTEIEIPQRVALLQCISLFEFRVISSVLFARNSIYRRCKHYYHYYINNAAWYEKNVLFLWESFNVLLRDIMAWDGFICELLNAFCSGLFVSANLLIVSRFFFIVWTFKNSSITTIYRDIKPLFK